jgi:glutathione reductase (NADPH)
MASTHYDLVVIGSGVAGGTIAHAGRDAGLRVAVVDDRPFGGTCAQRGCDPKKIMVHATHLRHQVRQRVGTGLDAAPSVAWGDLMAFKRSFTDDIPERTEEGLREAGIYPYRGTARFADEQALAVVREEGSDETLTFDRVAIAAGAKPVTLGIPGEEHFTYSWELLEWDTLPDRIVFVGGGYISCEFAHLVARAGADAVHIVQRSPRLLPHFDADIVERLTEASEASGITVHTDHTVTAIEADGGAHTVVAEPGGDGAAPLRLAADAVVHGAGRAAPLDAMNLEAAGIARNGQGLALNAYLQSTSNPAVYAAGDVSGRSLGLTPTAGVEASAVAHNIVHGNEQTPDLAAVPTVAFTTPRLASVGLTEEDAEQRGLDVTIHDGDVDAWDSSAHRGGGTYARYKILTDPEGHIVGAHLIYPKAEELINTFALAMRHGLTADDLQESLYAYPTSSSDIPYMLE